MQAKAELVVHCFSDLWVRLFGLGYLLFLRHRSLVHISISSSTAGAILCCHSGLQRQGPRQPRVSQGRSQKHRRRAGIAQTDAVYRFLGLCRESFLGDCLPRCDRN